jgi:hypothetical protein
MDIFSANIIDLDAPIETNIVDLDGNIDTNLKDSVIVVEERGISTYTINFDANGTQYGFYSKHFGNITSIETTNIDSYTIDGNPVSLPQAIELNTTYLIEIVKTAPGTAQIVLTVQPSEYDELINKVDFTIGDGRYTYLLGNYSTNHGVVYKVDNELLKASNYVGAGVWTINPIVKTFNLPTLPADTYWYKSVYLKDDRILFAACKYGVGDISLTTINSSDEIRDMDGNLNAYSFYDVTNYILNYYVYGIFYDYVRNHIYFKLYTGSLASTYKYVIDSNTMEVGRPQRFSDIQFSSSVNKIFFNPYKKTFVLESVFDLENNKQENLIYYSNLQKACIYNRVNGRYYKSGNNNYAQIYEMDENSRLISTQIATKELSAIQNYSYSFDHDNNVIVGYAAGNRSFLINRYDENNKRARAITFNDGSIRVLQGMHSKYLGDHLCIGNKGDELIVLDVSDPEGTLKFDRAYLTLPGEVQDIYTNQIL